MFNNSTTKVNEKDYWRTPPALIDDALLLLKIDRFNVDVCCSDDSKIKQSASCITEDENALTSRDWFINGLDYVSFCNPPFSKMLESVKVGIAQVSIHQKPVLFVLPYNPASMKWRLSIDPENCIVYVPDGRYNFLTKDGGPNKSACPFPVALVLAVPFFTGGARYINYKRGIGK